MSKTKPGEIFKVQLSIVTNHETRRVLVYNEDRSIYGEHDADKSMLDFMGNDLKAYVVGWWDKKTGKVHISHKCEAQPW